MEYLVPEKQSNLAAAMSLVKVILYETLDSHGEILLTDCCLEIDLAACRDQQEYHHRQAPPC